MTNLNRPNNKDSLSDALTLCVCVRNGGLYVDSCLSSVEVENTLYGCTVVLVDHLSTDGSTDRLIAWQKRFASSLYVRCEKEGISNARNAAWRAAKTPWVAFLDVDCVLRPDWFDTAKKLLKKFEANTEVAALGGANFVLTSEKTIYRAYSLFLSTYIGGHGSPLNSPVDRVKEQNHVPTLNVIYRRAALEDINGFDKRFRRVGEDLDLSFRLRKNGYKLLACPGLSAEHALRPDLQSWVKNMFLYGRGRFAFLVEHPGSFELKFLAPPTIPLVYLFTMIFFVLLRVPFPLLIWLSLPLLHFFSIMILIFVQATPKPSNLKVWVFAGTMVYLTHLAYGTGFIREMLGRKSVVESSKV